eukprot:FR735127.1.p1 GENE.FR735127.1~~FR735127.1.p1  ORF type:complete len:123 (+),score=1.49 FR735127.1:513-881(+)
MRHADHHELLAGPGNTERMSSAEQFLERVLVDAAVSLVSPAMGEFRHAVNGSSPVGQIELHQPEASLTSGSFEHSPSTREPELSENYSPTKLSIYESFPNGLEIHATVQWGRAKCWPPRRGL